MKKSKVLCIGEALIDRIRNKSNQGFTDFLGGAPANVACALRKLKIDSIFIGRLGSDDFGKKFIEKFNELKVNLDFLQLDKDLSTRVVNVEINLEIVFFQDLKQALIHALLMKLLANN